MAVENWVKKLTEEIVGGPPVEIGKRYLHPQDGVITITSGSYWGTHGLSNFWYWTDEQGEQHCGYGDSWPEAGHRHQWVRKQNETTNGYLMPPYEACECGDARLVKEDPDA